MRAKTCILIQELFFIVSSSFISNSHLQYLQLVGDLNSSEESEEAQHQQQSEQATDDPKVESEDEGTGQDLPESCENSEDEVPVIKVDVAEELIEVQESGVEETIKEVNDKGSGEECQELGDEESLDKKVKEETKEPLQEEEEADHNKENHVNGTSDQQNNFDSEEQLTKEEEENNKNKEQEADDIVDFTKKEFRSNQEESQQSISELKSKWDSIGKEQNCSPTELSHNNMADTTKTSRFVSTFL